VIQDHRLALGGDPPGEPAAHRDAHALVYLFLQPRGRGREQLARRKVQQQHRRGVGLQGLSGAFQQLGKQIPIVETRQRRICDRLDGPEPVFNGDRAYWRCHLDTSHLKGLGIRRRRARPRPGT
jgi:hypothetical protein